MYAHTSSETLGDKDRSSIHSQDQVFFFVAITVISADTIMPLILTDLNFHVLYNSIDY